MAVAVMVIVGGVTSTPPHKRSRRPEVRESVGYSAVVDVMLPIRCNLGDAYKPESRIQSRSRTIALFSASNQDPFPTRCKVGTSKDGPSGLAYARFVAGRVKRHSLKKQKL